MSGVTVATISRSIARRVDAGHLERPSRTPGARDPTSPRRRRRSGARGCPVRSRIHSSIVSTSFGELVVRDHALGHVAAEARDRDRAAVRAAITRRPPRRSACRARRARRRRSRAPCPCRSGRAPSRPRTTRSSTSPGRTIRLKRTSSMPAKSASLPRFSGCESTATAPHWASASTIFTPGMIGLPGKVAGAVVVGDRLARDHALARHELEHLVDEQERIAVRKDRLDLRACRATRHAESRSRRLLAAAVRVALRRADRQARSPAEISAKPRSNASFSATTVACAGGSSARQRPSSRRVSAAVGGGDGVAVARGALVLDERLGAARVLAPARSPCRC